MTNDRQLKFELFELKPLNAGKAALGLNEGGLANLTLHNFKGIQEMDLAFEPITLLVGGNNSGKSTVLQAIRLFYYCIDKCGIETATGRVNIKKHVMPFSDFSLVPAHALRELVTGGLTPNTKKSGIKLRGELNSGQVFDFTIYAAYSTLMVIAPEASSTNAISKDEFDAYRRQPLYVPGFFGVVTKELLATNRRLEELLASGHHNEVLRNLILRLRGSSEPSHFQYIVDLLQRQFGVTFKGIPGDPNRSEYLRAAYVERGTRVPLDIVSSGAGFLQILQFLAHALQSPSPMLLLDEPDAHMHVQLQERFIDLLRSFASERKLQVVMASHSETFLRNVNLTEIRLIDRKTGRADSFADPITLQTQLNSQGIWPRHEELAEALRIKRVVLCESPADAELLSAFGKKHERDWGLAEKMFQVIGTEGSNENTVARVEFVTQVLNSLLNGNVQAAYLRDRDLMCDEWIEEMKREAHERGLSLFITSRRNRESYLVEPRVVETAVLAQDRNVPSQWQTPGTIQTLVKQWCLEFCETQLDDMTGKIEEYNIRWMRSRFGDDDAQRKARTRLNEFIRTAWHEQIRAKAIPWSLMDGRGALKYVRQKLAENSIQLSDKVLVEHIASVRIPPEFKSLVETICSWTASTAHPPTGR